MYTFILPALPPPIIHLTMMDLVVLLSKDFFKIMFVCISVICRQFNFRFLHYKSAYSVKSRVLFAHFAIKINHDSHPIYNFPYFLICAQSCPQLELQAIFDALWILHKTCNIILLFMSWHARNLVPELIRAATNASPMQILDRDQLRHNSGTVSMATNQLEYLTMNSKAVYLFKNKGKIV